ncbi:hypothetical protein Pd630_LPD05388 [Rhodococcus opacus PD630]|nr:hypothetical protein Pd630_LPD05388 [Rhodococcus opacus PD630]
MSTADATAAWRSPVFGPLGPGFGVSATVSAPHGTIFA